jgi:hypothetical protein
MADTPSWDGPVHGELGRLAEEGDRVPSHVCGRWYRSLAAHVLQRHGLTGAEYRAAFDLAAFTPVGLCLRAVR